MASLKDILQRECHCPCTNEGRNHPENFHFSHVSHEVKKIKEASLECRDPSLHLQKQQLEKLSTECVEKKL